ncbi:MAG: hypothetical protein E6I97_23570, partial [Chloroflexi bacterium]
MECQVAGYLVKVLAEEVGWSLAPGKEGRSGLPHHKKGPKGYAEADRIIHHIPWEYPPVREARKRGRHALKGKAQPKLASRLTDP